MTRTLILAALLALAQPALADCYTPEQLKADVAKAGDTILETIHWRADHTDTVVIVQGNSAVSIFGFKNGCSTGGMPLGTVTSKNKGVPA